MEKLKRGTVVEAENFGKFLIKIIKHDPDGEIAFCKVVMNSVTVEVYNPERFWRDAPYCIASVTEDQNIIARKKNFMRLGDTSTDRSFTSDVFENLSAELARARTSITNIAYGGDTNIFPPQNVLDAFNLYKKAHLKAEIAERNG